jgi:hypothetical protein
MSEVYLGSNNHGDMLFLFSQIPDRIMIYLRVKKTWVDMKTQVEIEEYMDGIIAKGFSEITPN